MSEKHDEKCLNPGARPLIINAEHDLRKLHIEHKIRASFLLRHILFLASYPELRICLKPQGKVYVQKEICREFNIKYYVIFEGHGRIV